MRPLCLAANGAWIASSLPAALAFRTNLDRAAEVQEAILLRILRKNGLGSIRSIREYQQRVPVRTYDEYGEVKASGITHYERTSGSSGAAKRIPYNRELRAEMGRAIAPWIVELFATHPAAFVGEAYWSISPVLSSEAPSISDEDHLGPIRARLVRAVQAVPPDVRFIQDLESFRRATLDHLMRCRTLSLISVWHPSFLLLLLGDLREQAAELWPNLRVISCWSDANAARDAAELARIFPRVYVQPKGLLSTEGFISIPIADAGAPALAYRSHFYELRCIETDRVVLATEGEVGKRYRVILTTGAGLYRYDTEDVIEIVGYRGTCPLLRFIGRAEHISDHYGEKLNELFVRERLERVLRDHDVVATFAMLACEENSYTLFIESAAGDASLLAAAHSLDETLRENIHYDYCRRLGQLDALRVFRIARNASTTYLAHAGQRLGDVKLTTLDPRGGWGGRFEGVWV
ncbi:MAG: GH3 auxin-responsive promoter family protein [Acidobacteriota bacterium]|nr:GH3 auxin-responsive promoter family protein [Acidobacteriota bacterium]